jgi:hypothetical protein
MEAGPNATRRSSRLLSVLSMVIAAAVVPIVSTSAATAASGSALGSGFGTAEALSRPNCDRETERIKVQYFATAPCVKGWPKGADNGGATAQGVTKGEIKVVVLIGDEERDLAPSNGGIRNYATGTNGIETNAINDHNAIYKKFYETWGRKVVFEFQRASGTDEAAQRADALAALDQRPFAILCMACQVVGAGGGAVFSAAVSGRGVPANPPPPTPEESAAPSLRMTAEFAARSLAGKPAKYAGDDALKTEQRKFGVLYDDSPAGPDISDFTTAFEKYGGKESDLVLIPFTVPTDPAQVSNAAQEMAPTLATKLKSEGVTTVVPFTAPTTATVSLTNAATAQQYFPEWLPGPFHDLDFYARMYDQEQWAHAFGNVWFPPWVDDQSDPILGQFQWFWGEDQGTYSPGADSLLRTLYTAVHLAGPTLNAKTYDAALSAFPPVGGAYSGMVVALEVSFAQPRGLAPRWATALGFWSPTTSGPSQIINLQGTGKYLYLDGGKRYLPGKYPKGDPGFFESDGAIATFPTLPPSDQPSTTYPCNGCPSNGGSQTPSNA